ncbi:PHA/PHB synthase family protein [Pandoraea cepalis]|uniref:Poly(3-hydroxyalkanoate) polymerase subunit PhaC n=1 Tax=Pandoraea cepalis TaxID=2508294 RepID=A0A5E4UDT5_9BURK|nr:poly-beta-hydroxybutyrate polymerase N-terminal domain-containing protein [Pandoraea cepalis]VVD98157.1 Poly(3-hydroxyalkanoate) polymerase subunit PhaC [Pandoraea cepalis]
MPARTAKTSESPSSPSSQSSSASRSRGTPKAANPPTRRATPPGPAPAAAASPVSTTTGGTPAPVETPEVAFPSSATSFTDSLDRAAMAGTARFTGNVSPAAVALAWADWAMHAATAPGHQLNVFKAFAAIDKPTASDRAKAGGPSVADRRFRDPLWDQLPFAWWRERFLRTQDFVDTMTGEIPGVERHHRDVVRFMARQWLDVFSPANVWFLNPEVINAVRDTHGQNLVSGAQRWWSDLRDMAAGHAPGAGPEACKAFCVGHDIAATPGKVVYRNAYFELLHYAPAQAQTWREPILIVPSWLLKYYILDLEAQHSLVRYLVAQGHNVFMMSWHNAGPKARGRGLDDYLNAGLLTALREVHRLTDNVPVHACGYCLGGTLLAIAAATLAREHPNGGEDGSEISRDHRGGDGRSKGSEAGSQLLASVTLLAAQSDFSEPGELGLFIDASQVAYLEAMMWRQGYISGEQLAGTFQLLNSRDLIWSRLMHDYLLGKPAQTTDFTVWNADTTRIPARLHSQCLRELYLNNALATGTLKVGGLPVALSDIRVPMFVVATERDHISPWRSVYKMHLLYNGDLTFALVSGGHNVGVVCEPGHPTSHHRVATRVAGAAYRDPDEWFGTTPAKPSSWWPAWQAWLLAQGSGKSVATAWPPTHSLCDAPGAYVLER